MKGKNLMTLNEQPLTPARWRRLHPHLRTDLRRVLGGKQAILNRPVLDVARMLCARDAYLLAWHLYQGLNGQPHSPCQDCGLGLLMDLRGKAILNLASTKGGLGKSTLTGHLAAEEERHGSGPVAIVDYGPQGSLARW
jgi:hypothetical protein